MKIKFVWIMLLLSILIASCAAYFSIWGLSQLFAGASLSVIIMASILETGKVVTTTALHKYWSYISKPLKVYLTISVGVLMIITSAGIYGFLSNAYQTTSNKLEVHEGQIGVLNSKKVIFENKIAENKKIIDSKMKRVDQLSNLRSNQENRLDASTSNRNRNSVRGDITSANSEIKQLNTDIELLTNKNNTISDSIGVYEIKILNLKSNSEIAGEVGPLKYISALTGISMDRVVNYLILLLIFVFDPLAIALVILTNKAFEVEKNIDTIAINPVEKEKIIEPIVEELIVEELIVEEPIVWDALIKEPLIIEVPVTELPIIEEVPVIEKPITIEIPVIELPLLDEAPILDEEPIIESSTMTEELIITEETPINEPIIKEEEVLEELIVEEPIIEEVIIEEPIIEKKTIIEKPVLEKKSITEGPSILEIAMMEEAVNIEDSTLEELNMIKEPIIIKDPIKINESIIEEPMVEENIVETTPEPIVDENIIEKISEDKIEKTPEPIVDEETVEKLPEIEEIKEIKVNRNFSVEIPEPKVNNSVERIGSNKIVENGDINKFIYKRSK